MNKLPGNLRASSVSLRDLLWPVPESLVSLRCAPYLVYEHPSLIFCFSQCRKFDISFFFPSEQLWWRQPHSLVSRQELGVVHWAEVNKRLLTRSLSAHFVLQLFLTRVKMEAGTSPLGRGRHTVQQEHYSVDCPTENFPQCPQVPC